MSIWADVEFDTGTSAAAAAELRAAAAHLDGLAERRATLADRARHDWTGQQRATFDRQLDLLQRSTGMLISDLLAAADTIEADVVEARHEQHRWREARERWRRDREVERVDREMR